MSLFGFLCFVCILPVIFCAARQKRKISAYKSHQWKDSDFPISYKFAANIPQEWKVWIDKAIFHWQDNTCLSFKKREKVPKYKAYIIFKQGDSCSSNAGKFSRSLENEIVLNRRCLQKYTEVGSIAHEIGHRLSLWHEHARPDRDRFVRIVTENIWGYSNFRKAKTTDLLTQVPYDYGSVMHYGPNDFAKTPGLRTLETINSDYQRTIGQREKPSFYDFKTVNLVYCKNRCQSQENFCKNGAYLHPKNCAICLCPNGFGGKTCERNEVQKTYALSRNTFGVGYAICGGSIQRITKFQDGPNYGNSQIHSKFTTS